MMPILLQTSHRVDPRVVLHEQFSKEAWDPETWTGIILVAVAIAVFALILHFILYYEKRLQKPKQTSNPEKLFREVLKQLELSIPQRALLARMARDLRVPSPTQMLLSPKLLSQASQQWLSTVRIASPKRSEDLQAIARKLFSETSTS